MRLNIPQIDPTLWQRLTIEARHRGLAISDLVAQALRQFLGLAQRKPAIEPETSLDQLAGTWTEEEAQEFEQNTQQFNQIDPDLWT